MLKSAGQGFHPSMLSIIGRKRKMTKKNLIKMGLAVAAATMVVTGCKKSGTNQGGSESSTAAAENESLGKMTDNASIRLGNYKGLKLTARMEDVTDAQMEEELERLQAQYPAEVTGRPAREGDVANIDYVGTRDGEAFLGGTGEGYDLTLGSGTFIDGFEDGVIGMSTGDEKDLNLTFPETYGNAELAGQDVVFHVTLNAIKSAAETQIDDELAKRVTGDDSATLEDLRNQVHERLVNQAESNYFNKAGSELLLQAIENSQVECDPDAVEDMYNQLKSTYTGYAGQYGMELEDFLSLFLGTDLDGLRESAENLVKQEMTLDEIIKAENIVPTEEQKNHLARMNYFSDAAEMISVYGEESASRLFSMGAAYYYLIENAIEAEAETTTAGAETEATTETAAP